AAVLQPRRRLRPPALLATQFLAEEHDLFAIELVLTLAERHPRLSGVDPHTGELAALRLPPDEPGAGALAAVGGREPEVRLEEASAVDHGLLALALLLEGLAGLRVERLGHVPLADELFEELLPGAGLRLRLERTLRVLLVVLLVGRLTGGEQHHRDGNQ